MVILAFFVNFDSKTKICIFFEFRTEDKRERWFTNIIWFSDPITEAVPQVLIQVAVVVSTQGIVDPFGSLFLVTFITSLLSATLGMAKFFKSGPIQLVPSDSYGCGFFTIMLLMATHLILKAVVLGAFIGFNKNSAELAFGLLLWSCFLVFPPLVFVRQ